MENAQTKSSAHVCTPKTPAVYIANQHQIDDTPPTNWVGHLIDGTHCTSSRNPPDAYLDYQIYRDSDRNIHGLSVRHDHYSKPGAHQVRVDKTIEGRTWKTWLRAVTDDFGWLVEVPTC